MNADGSAQGRLTAPRFQDGEPSWQPLPRQTRARLTPMGSGSLREIAASHAGDDAVVLTNGP